MTAMNLQDWPRDEQIVPEAVLDCLCHRLLTLLSPTYRVLEVLGDPRALEMRDEIRKHVEESEWRGRVRAREIQDSILKQREEGDWVGGMAARGDSTGLHAPNIATEQ